MGFDLERLVDELDDELKCTLCLGLLKDPLQLSMCEHVFCSSCIQKWVAKDLTCPIDHQSLTHDKITKAPLILQRLLDKVKLTCEFSKYGCKVVLPLSNLENHQLKCEFDPDKMIRCGKECGMIMTQSQLLQHNCVQQYILASIETHQKQLTSLVNHLETIEKKHTTEIQVLKDQIDLLKKEFDESKSEETTETAFERYYHHQSKCNVHDQGRTTKKVLVKLNEKTLILDVDPKEQIAMIKGKIRTFENVDPEEISIFFANQELEDNKTLFDYHIYKISNPLILFVVKRKIKIFIRVTRDKEMSLEVSPKDKIGDLLEIILKKEGKEWSGKESQDYILCFRNEHLNENRTIFSYKIRDGNFIFLNSFKEFQKRQAQLITTNGDKNA